MPNMVLKLCNLMLLLFVLTTSSLVIKTHKRPVMTSLSVILKKTVSEYDQEIPQSQTADKPMASRGRATQQSKDAKKTKLAKQPALSSPSRWLQK